VRQNRVKRCRGGTAGAGAALPPPDAPTIEAMNADAPQQALPPPPTPSVARPRGLRLARIWGVPVYVNASWLLLAAVLIIWYGPYARRMMPGLTEIGGYSLAVAFVGCLLLSVLLHEVGHALVARHFSIGVKAITLELLGGYTEMEGDSPSAKADFFVSAIGPVVSGVIGGAALVGEIALPNGTLLNALAFQLAWSNIVVAIFNALPGLPLDGGRVLRAVVWGISGDQNTGTAAAGWLGRGVAVATLLASVWLLQAGLGSLLNVVFAAFIALTMWQGASAAIVYARLAKRLPEVNLWKLARPIFAVPLGTPLAEAMRRAAEAGAPASALAVGDSNGRVVALINEQAAVAVPAERRPWIPIDSVARTLDAGRTLAADLAGADVIRAVQAHPGSNYLIVAGDDVVGVLETADLARVLNR
jgi:Zn-dependent protease